MIELLPGRFSGLRQVLTMYAYYCWLSVTSRKKSEIQGILKGCISDNLGPKRELCAEVVYKFMYQAGSGNR